jgi:hypothetical protein
LPPAQRTLAAIPKRLLLICTPPDARGSILRGCNHFWRAGPPHGETGANKRFICRNDILDFLLKASPLRARERGTLNEVRGRGQPVEKLLTRSLRPQIGCQTRQFWRVSGSLCGRYQLGQTFSTGWEFSEARQERFGDHPFGGGPAVLPAAMALRAKGVSSCTPRRMGKESRAP